MNTYHKYCPNVYVAKCEKEYSKGDIITVTTRNGKEHECEVHNLVGKTTSHFYYSITRTDEYNYAQSRAERYESWAKSADKRADEYYDKSMKDQYFLKLGEPIKVGHHSEKRHRKAVEDAWNNTGKMVEQMDKAESHRSKADYWAKKAGEVNLSMPVSLDYFTIKLAEAKEYHEGLKSGKYPKEHSFSMQYARKNVKELENKVAIATKLWA